MWKVLDAANEAAKVSNRVPCTNKETLPTWVPHGLVVGKSWLGSEWGAALQLALSASTLAQLGQDKISQFPPPRVGCLYEVCSCCGLGACVWASVIQYIDLLGKVRH